MCQAIGLSDLLFKVTAISLTSNPCYSVYVDAVMLALSLYTLYPLFDDSLHSGSAYCYAFRNLCHPVHYPKRKINFICCFVWM